MAQEIEGVESQTDSHKVLDEDVPVEYRNIRTHHKGKSNQANINLIIKKLP